MKTLCEMILEEKPHLREAIESCLPRLMVSSSDECDFVSARHFTTLVTEVPSLSGVGNISLELLRVVDPPQQFETFKHSYTVWHQCTKAKPAPPLSKQSDGIQWHHPNERLAATIIEPCKQCGHGKTIEKYKCEDCGQEWSREIYEG